MNGPGPIIMEATKWSRTARKIPAAQKGKGKDKEAVKKDTNEDSASDSGTKQTGSKKAKLSPSEAGQMTLEGFAA